MHTRALLHPVAWHPAATPACARCGGTGWCLDPGAATIRTRPCACVGSCPACDGSGFRHGGLELCACRIARERAALLDAAGLVAPAEPRPAPPAVAAWFARYRPEPGWPWLTVAGHGDAAVVQGLAWLVTGIGVPVHVVTPSTPRSDWARWSRVVACFDVGALGLDAEHLVDRCARGGLTLVVTASRAPFPEAGQGLEDDIGERATLELVTRGEVVVVG